MLKKDIVHQNPFFKNLLRGLKENSKKKISASYVWFTCVDYHICIEIASTFTSTNFLEYIFLLVTFFSGLMHFKNQHYSLTFWSLNKISSYTYMAQWLYKDAFTLWPNLPKHFKMHEILCNRKNDIYFAVVHIYCTECINLNN